MNRLLSWLKRQARKWCAPGYDDLVKVALKVVEDAKSIKPPSGFPVVMADDAPKWEGPDADRWRHFLTTTETGQKIQMLANWHEQNANRAAVLRLQGADNNAGFARGWHNATAYFFQTLSAPVPPQTDQEDKQPGDGASQLLERVAP